MFNLISLVEIAEFNSPDRMPNKYNYTASTLDLVTVPCLWNHWLRTY